MCVNLLLEMMNHPQDMLVIVLCFFVYIYLRSILMIQKFEVSNTRINKNSVFYYIRDVLVCT